MKMVNLNIGLPDFSDDINVQLCTLCKLTKAEVVYVMVMKKIRGIDAARTNSTIQKGVAMKN